LTAALGSHDFQVFSSPDVNTGLAVGGKIRHDGVPNDSDINGVIKAHVPQKPQEEKVADAIMAAQVTDSVEFAKLTDPEKIQKLYEVVSVLAKKELGISL